MQKTERDMIKLLCSDIDNTLLKKDGGAGDSVLKRLKTKGILPMLATGRSVADVFAIFRESRENTVVASLDGGLVLIGDSVLVDRPVDGNIVRAFFDGFVRTGPMGCAAIFYTAADCYVTDESAEKMMRAQNSMQGRVKRISDPRDIPSPVYKISVYSETEKDFDYLFADWENYMNCVYRKDHWCEFVSAGTDKGTALSLVMEKFMINRDEVIAFGDGENDFTMLETAGCSYAVEGSPAHREGKADFVTKDAVRTIEELLLK